MKKKRGFTLIELLAVVVVLGIVTLIATPVIKNILLSTRRNAFKDSAYGIVNSAKNYYSNQTSNYNFSGKTFTFNSDIKDLNFDGKKPEGGTVTVREDGEIELYVTDGEFCAYKSFENTDIFISNVTEKGCAKTLEKPNIKTIGKKVTSNTIALEAQCTLDSNSKSKIIKYEFSKDGINWNSKIVDEKYLNYYTYKDLKQDDKYTFKARCITDMGITAEEDVNITLRDITKPSIVIPSGWAREKNVTINYPKGRYKYQMSEDEGKTWENIKTESGSSYNTYKKTYQNNGTIILARVLDESGNYVNSDSAKITGIDRTNPNCRLEVESGTKATDDNIWYKSNVVIKAVTWDSESGIENTGVTNKTTEDYSSEKYTLTTDGENTIYGYVKDKAGNKNNCSITILKDSTPPSCKYIENSTWTKNDVEISIKCASDATSGCGNKISTWKITKTRKKIEKTATIQDNAGNVTTCKKTMNVYVDKTSPTITISSITNMAHNSYRVNLSIKDSDSGLKSYTVAGGGSKSTTSTTIPSYYVATKVSTITFKIIDNVGNTTTKTFNLNASYQYIEQLYTAGLGRHANSTELKYWYDQYKAGQMPINQLVKNIYLSTEATNKWKNNNSGFVTALYKGVLGREPDSEGHEYWTKELNSGTAKSKLLDTVMALDEFQELIDFYSFNYEVKYDATASSATCTACPSGTYQSGNKCIGTRSYDCSESCSITSTTWDYIGKPPRLYNTCKTGVAYIGIYKYTGCVCTEGKSWSPIGITECSAYYKGARSTTTGTCSKTCTEEYEASTVTCSCSTGKMIDNMCYTCPKGGTFDSTTKQCTIN